MRGTKIDLADDPETKRHLTNTKTVSNVQYHGDLERKQKQEANRPLEDEKPQSELLYAIRITFYDVLSV